MARLFNEEILKKRQFICYISWSDWYYYKLIGEKSFAQLTEENFFNPLDKHGNSIATIVKHLHGIMLSRWTNFLVSDGEKPWRNRDDEFKVDTLSKTAYLEK